MAKRMLPTYEELQQQSDDALRAVVKMCKQIEDLKLENAALEVRVLALANPRHLKSPLPVPMPEGWKLVPVEPTEEMVTTFLVSYLRGKSAKGFVNSDDELEALVAASIRDALAAAPKSGAENG